ncbi:Histone deacetylase, related [Neospora caninum Liverpool]|uniref:Histone deacetylase, related n=1 Tax=Neospora caninum (strain Liverpool) TaxID=572307 RepID=F0VFI3_NEOCL|nr:Histone deacetylase, related [Neospora caninum Liverpool]CBZ52477.1 Histone deacetylase, related [Neospora caninum Liverpool]|eukprot:XP_003882509.1 Histone deacetylase, related [Neospora caninum Liverpool]
MKDTSEGSSKEETPAAPEDGDRGQSRGEETTKDRSSPFTSVWRVSDESASGPHCREGSLHKLIAANNISGVRLWLSNPICRGMINDLNHAGETPLHVAVQCCSPRILSLLLDPPALQISPSLLASCSLRQPRPLAGATDAPSVAASAPAENVAGAVVSPRPACEPSPASDAAATAEAACAKLAMAAASRVDFSLSVDGIPTLHLLIGRTAFGGARGEDAMECLKRILLHIGRYQPGAADRCPRCSPAKARACGRDVSEQSAKAEAVAGLDCSAHASEPLAGGEDGGGSDWKPQSRCPCCGLPDGGARPERSEAGEACCPAFFPPPRNTPAADRVFLDLEETDVQGRTPLHLACSFGVAAVAELLLHAGASPWARRRGVAQMPLHSAIDADDPACCLLLLRHSVPCRFLVDAACLCGSRGDRPGGLASDARSHALALKRSPATKLILQLLRRCVRRGAWKCFRALLAYPMERGRARSPLVDAAAGNAEGDEPAVARRHAASPLSATRDSAAPWCSALHALLDDGFAAWLCLREEARRSGAAPELRAQLQRVVAKSPACCQAAAASWGMALPGDLGDGPARAVKDEDAKHGLLQALGGASGEEGLSTRGEGRTMVVTHALCLEHLPLPEPADMPLKRHKLMQRFPENPSRLEVVTSARSGILRTREFSPLLWMDDPMPASLSDILRVHSMSYIARLKLRVEDAFGISTRLPSLSPPSETLRVSSPTGAAALAAATAALDSKLQKEQYEQQKHQQIENVGPAGRYSFVFADGDTPVTCFSWAAAVHAAGAVIAAVDAVCEGKCRNAFCAVRPPGHHLGNWGAAQTASNKLTDEDIAAGSQGFCLLNNVAIGAAYAKYNYARKGIRRIAVVDFDVHHGNGTEQIIRNVGMKIRKVKQPKGAALRLYRRAADELRGAPLASSDLRDAPASGDTGRADPCEMDSGAPDKTAAQDYVGEGGKVSGLPQSVGPVDVPQWMGWRDERDAEELFFASIHAFDGTFYPGTGADCEDYSFDGHAQDQIGGAFGGFAEDDFRFFTHALVRCAERTCEGRVVSVLEGGYSVSGGVSSTLAASVKEHLRGLMRTSSGGRRAVDAVRSERPEAAAESASGQAGGAIPGGKCDWADDVEVGDEAASDVTLSDVEESWRLLGEGSPRAMDSADSAAGLSDERREWKGSGDGRKADAWSWRRPREPKGLNGNEPADAQATVEIPADSGGVPERERGGEHAADLERYRALSREDK